MNFKLQILTIAITLFVNVVTNAQTKVECKIIIENLTREKIVINNISTLNNDDKRKEIAGPWKIVSGGRNFLLDNKNFIFGRDVIAEIELQDGAIFKLRHTHSEPTKLAEGECIVLTITDAYPEQFRKKDTDRELTESQRTYRYWNTIHAIYLEETTEAIQKVDVGDVSKLAAYLREIAKRFEDLDTTGVDRDAVVAAHAYAKFLRETVTILNSPELMRKGVALIELYNLKADTFAQLLDEEQKAVAKTETLYEFIRTRKKTLEKTHNLTFPHLVPPISIHLEPFIFSVGYYVNLKNTSGEDMKNVQIRFRDIEGNVNTHKITDRLSFGPKIPQMKVDPSKHPWRVSRTDWITIIHDDGTYSLPAAVLIKK
jgi:hypothetical protein